MIETGIDIAACTDSNQLLHHDKDHQVLFMGGQQIQDGGWPQF